MSFLRKIFSSNKPSSNKKKIYNSIDNLGTVYTDNKKVDAAWQVQGMMFGQEQEFTLYYGSGYEKSKEITSKGHPFICFTLNNENDAKNGLSSISFIKKASDTNEYISLEIIEFGYYETDKGDTWEVIFWGENLSTEMYNEAKTKLDNAGGKMKGGRIPTKKSQGQPNSKEKIKKEKVKYEKTYNEGSNTYETHKAPSKSAALAFLKNKSVTKSLYYVIVETPEGNWGKDIDGIYQE